MKNFSKFVSKFVSILTLINVAVFTFINIPAYSEKAYAEKNAKDMMDNDMMSMGFDTVPASSIITSGGVDIITEDAIRYHVIKIAGGSFTPVVIETKTDVILIDVGPVFIPKAGIELRAYVDAIGKPASIIITHAHGDHYGNIANFSDFTVYTQSDVVPTLMASKNFTDNYNKPVVSVKSSKTIAGLKFKFKKVKNAEAAVNGYVYIPSTKALFVGDLVYNKAHNFLREYTPLDSTDELNNWIAGLNGIKSTYKKYNHVFVGHNGTRTDIATVIDENINYLQDARDLITGVRALTAGGFSSTNVEVTGELALLYPNYLTSGLALSLPGAFFPEDPGAKWFE